MIDSMKIKKIIKMFIVISIFSLRIVKKFFKEVFGHIVFYPDTIQLPITNKCNFNCVMCGVRSIDDGREFSHTDLSIILTDKLFKKVKYIGLNGGEPFLKKDLIDCIDSIIKTLPQLQAISIISNGFLTKRITEVLPMIKKKCTENNVVLNISFSLDGTSDMQDFHRGHIGAYKNLNNTIDIILANKSKYADSVNVICTITRFNIDRINEVEVWSKKTGVKVLYNIATINKRINNNQKLDSFSIFNDEHSKMMAQEFFYKKYYEENDEKYFSLYLYIRYKKRYDDCPCMHNHWITLTPNANISFCSTHSKELGSSLNESPYSLVRRNRNYLLSIRREYCGGCSHYMSGLNYVGLIILLKERIRNVFFI